MVRPGPLERLGHVRHLGHDVARVPPLRLRDEERLGALVVARLQPDLPDGLPVGLAAAVGRDDGGRVDPLPVRRHARGEAVAPRGGPVRAHQRRGLPRLRVHRDRPVRGGLPPVPTRRRRRDEREPLGPRHHGHRDALRGQGGHVQRRVHRGPPVRHHDRRVPLGGVDRDVPGVAGDARGGHARRVEQRVVRVDPRPRLGRSLALGQREDRGRRLHDVRGLLHDDAVQGRALQHGRAGPELRHAADPLGPDAEGGRQDERAREPRPDGPALHAHHRAHGPRAGVLPRRAGRHGVRRQLRAHPPLHARQLHPDGPARAADRGPAGGLHEHVRRDGQRRPGLHRQRRLQAVPQPGREREDVRLHELHRLDRRRRHRDGVRVRRGQPQHDRAVARGRALRRLRGLEPAQVALVAVQQLRLLLGDARRHRRRRHRGARDGPARARLRRGDPALRLPADPGALARRLRRREPADRARPARGPPRLLPQGPPLGLLGAGPRRGRGRAPGDPG